MKKGEAWGTGDRRELSYNVGFFLREAGKHSYQVGFFLREAGKHSYQVGFFLREARKHSYQVGFFLREAGKHSYQVGFFLREAGEHSYLVGRVVFSSFCPLSVKNGPVKVGITRITQEFYSSIFLLSLPCTKNIVVLCLQSNKNKTMVNEEIADILTQEANAVRNIPLDSDYEGATDLIIEYVHHRGGKLITSGMGKAGQIAMNMATTFSSTGTPASFLHPSEAQHGDLGIVRENDVMLLVSNSGRTRELVELVDLTRGLVPGMKFIVITGNPESELAREAAICLPTGAPAEVCPLGLTPTTSTTVMTVIGDILVVRTMKKIGFTNREYAKRHHGGYLGSKSRAQSQEEK